MMATAAWLSLLVAALLPFLGGRLLAAVSCSVVIVD